MELIPFLIYVSICSFTPGPNTCMAMSFAATQGLGRALWFCLGVFFGILAVMACCALFSSFLASRLEQAGMIMRFLGTAYMVWLAWAIWRSSGVKQGQVEKGGQLVLNGAILQFLNVKLIFYGITLFGTFVLPYYQGNFPALSVIIVVLALFGLASTTLWSLGGAALSRLFCSHPKLINSILAILLLFCVVSLWM